MKKPQDFADDKQLDMKVRQIFGLIKDSNYTGEVLQVIYTFLLEYSDILAATKTTPRITFQQMIDDLNQMHRDLILELKSRIEEEVIEGGD